MLLSQPHGVINALKTSLETKRVTSQFRWRQKCRRVLLWQKRLSPFQSRYFFSTFGLHSIALHKNEGLYLAFIEWYHEICITVFDLSSFFNGFGYIGSLRCSSYVSATPAHLAYGRAFIGVIKQIIVLLRRMCSSLLQQMNVINIISVQGPERYRRRLLASRHLR